MDSRRHENLNEHNGHDPYDDYLKELDAFERGDDYHRQEPRNPKEPRSLAKTA